MINVGNQNSLTYSWQMEDGHRLIDYGINVNDVVQLMIRAAPLPAAENKEDKENCPQEESGADGSSESQQKPNKAAGDPLVDTACEYYEV